MPTIYPPEWRRDDAAAWEEQFLAPQAMTSGRTRGRDHPEVEHPLRTSFQRDRDRIIHSGAFRRLEYKTQVFVNHEGDYYRTRLTHTMEAAQITRTVAKALKLNEDLAEAVALAHVLHQIRRVAIVGRGLVAVAGIARESEDVLDPSRGVVVEDLVDLLHAEEIHAEGKHADSIPGVGPFTRFGYGMVVELQSMTQEIEKGISACRQHRYVLHLASRTVFHVPRDSFVTAGGRMLCRPDGPYSEPGSDRA